MTHKSFNSPQTSQKDPFPKKIKRLTFKSAPQRSQRPIFGVDNNRHPMRLHKKGGLSHEKPTYNPFTGIFLRMCVKRFSDKTAKARGEAHSFSKYLFAQSAGFDETPTPFRP